MLLIIPICELLHFFTADSLFFNQSESYYTLFNQSVSYYTFFTVYMYKKYMLQHYLAFIALLELNYEPFIVLLLMELDYGLCDIVICMINTMASAYFT